ncbi:DUF2165 family protein [Sphingomicrobium marinum]|uniref:DUF2165 family protein n=1 Tax=Sphingomicrobium marinum TaxID=1227950 RepID=UPI002240D9E4|nr:DUF2165 family protein [Sphingomicrobium marinum]
MLRWIKIALVTLVGLHALFYLAQNLANLGAAHSALAYVLSGAEHEVYTQTAFFHSGSSLFAWIALSFVLAGEGLTAFFGLKGGFDMFKARGAAPNAFHRAKRAAVYAGAFALLTWFGMFLTFGAAFFQMWQTQLGAGSYEGAFIYAMASAVTILFVYHTED